MVCRWAAILLTFESVVCQDVDLGMCFVAVSNVWLRQRDVRTSMRSSELLPEFAQRFYEVVASDKSERVEFD